MYDACGILFLFLEQPMHPGSGESAVHVDLPIQRERHTQYPLIQSSGVKGALKSAARQRGMNTTDLDWIFGPPDSSSAGAIVLTDARTLLFPVKSALDVFGWVTCPHVLGRLATDLRAGKGTATRSNAQQPALAALDALSTLPIGAVDDAVTAVWPDGCPLIHPTNGRVYFEESVFLPALRPVPDVTGASYLDQAAWDARRKDLAELTALLGSYALPASAIAWAGWLARKTVTVPDKTFETFVRFTTDIETHVRIGEDGRVAQTGPWDVEFIPAETLLYCLVGFQGSASGTPIKARQRVKRLIDDDLPHLQIGGDATLGRGITALRFAPVESLLEGSREEGHK